MSSVDSKEQREGLQKYSKWLAGCGCFMLLLIAAVVVVYFMATEGIELPFFGQINDLVIGSLDVTEENQEPPEEPPEVPLEEPLEEPLEQPLEELPAEEQALEPVPGPASGELDVIVYSVLDGGEFHGIASELYVLGSDASHHFEIFKDEEGFIFSTVGQNYLGVQTPGESDLGSLGLVSAQDGSYSYLGTAPLSLGYMQVVSRDGSRLAFSEFNLEDESRTLVVFETGGGLVTRIENYMPLEFVSNSKVLVLRYEEDTRGFAGFGVIDLDSGNYIGKSIQNMDPLSLFPHASSDGKYIFYGVGESLFKFDVNSGNDTNLYQFAHPELDFSNRSMTFLEGINQAFLIENGDLYLINTEDGTAMQIDSRVVEETSGWESVYLYDDSGDYDERYFYGVLLGKSVIGAPLIASPNGEYFAYLVKDGGGVDLKVYSFSDGTSVGVERGGYWYTYSFTPDSKALAVLEYANSSENEMQMFGDLYIADLDGTGRAVLDANVTSYLISRDGQNVYYAVTDSTKAEEAHSSIYRARLNGEDKIALLMNKNGFVWLVDLLD